MVHLVLFSMEDSPVACGEGGRCPFEIVDILVLTPRQIHMVQTVPHIMEIHQYFVGKVIDVHDVPAERVPHVPWWR